MWKMATKESELLTELAAITKEWSALELTFKRSEDLKFDIGEGRLQACPFLAPADSHSVRLILHVSFQLPTVRSVLPYHRFTPLRLCICPQPRFPSLSSTNPPPCGLLVGHGLQTPLLSSETTSSLSLPSPASPPAVHNVVDLAPAMKGIGRRLENIAMSPYIGGIQERYGAQEKRFQTVKAVMTEVDVFQTELISLARLLLVPELKATFGEAASGEGLALFGIECTRPARLSLLLGRFKGPRLQQSRLIGLQCPSRPVLSWLRRLLELRVKPRTILWILARPDLRL